MQASNGFLAGSKSRNALLLLLSVVFLLACFTSMLHWMQPNAFLIDRIIPPLSAIWMGVLFLRTYFFSNTNLHNIFCSFLICSALALITPAWFYTWYADSFHVRLIDIYPPISVLLVILTIVVLLVFETRDALRWGGAIWVLNASPMLLYLLTHKSELWLPRGLDLLVAYGPALFSVVAVVPFHRNISYTLKQLTLDYERVKNMADRDPLTDLFNRRGAIESFSMLLNVSSMSSVAVMMLDIDHFKSVNDMYGHSTGDRVLREIAARLRTVLDETCVIARWGGEEFLVVIPNIESQELTTLAARFHRVVEYLPFNDVGRVTVSIGAVLYQEKETLESLIDRADKALYEAKLTGRNQVVCHA